MKIERDKVYLTRCGQKVRVVCVDAPGDMPVIGISKGGNPDTWTDDGFYVASKLEAHNDLVSEYVEPPKPREVWVYSGYDGSFGRVYDNPHSAHSSHAERLVKFREVIEA